jgi:group I intron endonuclease
MTISGIYMIRHKESGKMYIGRSTDVHNRWDLHKRHAEQRKNNSPLHRAMRKYGCDAFEWKVLLTAPAKLHIGLEHLFMSDWGTMAPAGYNVGGAAGGFAPRQLRDDMGADEQQEQLGLMREQARKMHVSVAEKRKDPEYDAWYKTRMSEAAKTRWAKRKARIAVDPHFAAQADAMWKARAKRAKDTIANRAAVDPEFAKHIHDVRSNAAKKARASDPRTVAAVLRRGDA